MSQGQSSVEQWLNMSGGIRSTGLDHTVARCRNHLFSANKSRGPSQTPSHSPPETRILSSNISLFGFVDLEP